MFETKEEHAVAVCEAVAADHEETSASVGFKEEHAVAVWLAIAAGHEETTNIG